MLSGRGLAWRVPSLGFHPRHSKLVKKKKNGSLSPVARDAPFHTQDPVSYLLSIAGLILQRRKLRLKGDCDLCIVRTLTESVVAPDSDKGKGGEGQLPTRPTRVEKVHPMGSLDKMRGRTSWQEMFRHQNECPRKGVEDLPSEVLKTR